MRLNHIDLHVPDVAETRDFFINLARTDEARQRHYREFVERGIHEHGLQFIRGAVQRNQLTGSQTFIREIEQ